jgi:hypothetical protein
MTSPIHKGHYYAYILCCIDGILVICHDPKIVLTEIHGYMPLKSPDNCDINIYLGAKVKETQLPNEVWAWGMSPSKYVQQAVKNCESQLLKDFNDHYKLLTHADDPFPTTYEPEMDVSEPLDQTHTSFYSHIIGVMRWMVGLVALTLPLKFHSSLPTSPIHGLGTS